MSFLVLLICPPYLLISSLFQTLVLSCAVDHESGCVTKRYSLDDEELTQRQALDNNGPDVREQGAVDCQRTRNS